MSEMRRVPNAGRIDVDWLSEVVADCATISLRNLSGEWLSVALQAYLDTTPPDASLPWVWSDQDGYDGPAVDNPLAIYFAFPLDGARDGNRPVWSTSVQELVRECVDEWCRRRPSEEFPPIVPGEICRAEQLRDSLRELSNEVDQLITASRSYYNDNPDEYRKIVAQERAEQEALEKKDRRARAVTDTIKRIEDEGLTDEDRRFLEDRIESARRERERDAAARDDGAA